MGTLGTFSAKLALNDRACRSTIHVYSALKTSLLGRDTCKRLGLLDEGWPQSRVQTVVQEISLGQAATENSASLGHTKAENGITAVKRAEIKAALISEQPEVFQDTPLRAMKGPAMHIELQEDAVPCKCYHVRTIPFHWREAVEQQLNSMVEDDIIEKVPVGEAFTWCHPVVIVPKKGTHEPRITVDLTGVNKYVMRLAYPTRMPREVVASIPPNMKFFTTLDSWHGFWQSST